MRLRLPLLQNNREGSNKLLQIRILMQLVFLHDRLDAWEASCRASLESVDRNLPCKGELPDDVFFANRNQQQKVSFCKLNRQAC